jgi:hypothetical protein
VLTHEIQRRVSIHAWGSLRGAADRATGSNATDPCNRGFSAAWELNLEPLDLRSGRPRSARAELAGIVFLPRSIDKVRATLPGGEIGDFSVPGFTTTMLGRLGISLADFTEAVRGAETDEDVAAYVHAHAVPGGIQAWHDFALPREIYNGDRADAIVDYPYLANHPDVTMSLDFLDLQDDYDTAHPR